VADRRVYSLLGLWPPIDQYDSSSRGSARSGLNKKSVIDDFEVHGGDLIRARRVGKSMTLEGNILREGVYDNPLG
jgi:hypothetical protein